MIDDRVLSESVAASTVDQLMACAPAIPLPAQERIYERVKARGMAMGLRLPRKFRLCWVEGRPGICAGATQRDARGHITVFLSVNARPDELERTTLHELAHVHDFASLRPLGRVEMERRAEFFVSRALGFCA